jgi:DNA-directed RNA polymerase specialized sigma24 family protein
MSAALTLPYVWATASDLSARRKAAVHSKEGLAFYRKRTESLLRRYLRASLAVGRVPSVTEDITLRGRTSSHRMRNFEDVVIFAIDVERCLKTLEPSDLQLVVKIALQEYIFLEAAEQLRQDVRSVTRRYGEALDLLTAELMKRKLLKRDGIDACQE